MAAGTVTIYGKNKDDININDLVAATVKMALVASSYTPNVDSSTGHALWSDVSGSEIANGNGYTTGGVALSSMAATAISGGFKFSSANPQWTASGGNIPAHRYYVLYVVGTLWGLTNPLIGYFLGDNTPADIAATSTGNTLTVTGPSGGWFDTV